MLVDERPEPDVELVQRAERADEVEAALAQSAPKPLYFAASWCVIGLGMDEGGAHARAGQAQCLPTIGRTVVEIEGVRRTVFAYGVDHQSQHVDFALGMMSGKRENVTARVVEDPVDPHGAALALDHQRRSVTDVGVPERARALGLPAQAHLTARVIAAAERHAVQTLLLIETPHTARGDGVLVESALGNERTQNDRY